MSISANEGEIRIKRAPSRTAGFAFFIGSEYNNAGLNVFDFRLLAFLACVASNADARASWWSIRKIAKVCGMSAFSVVKATKSLKTRGFIDIETRIAEHGGK